MTERVTLEAGQAAPEFSLPDQDGTVPVSYTHLDVYKRQGISTVSSQILVLASAP